MGLQLPSWLDVGASTASCNVLSSGSRIAADIAVYSAMTRLIWPTIGAAAGALAMSSLGAAMGCTVNPGNPPGNSSLSGSFCSDRAVPTEFISDGKVVAVVYGVQSVSAFNSGIGTPPLTYFNVVGWKDSYSPGNAITQTFAEAKAGAGIQAKIVGNCGTSPKPVPVGGKEGYTYNYVDASTNCTYIYAMRDVYIDETGLPNMQWDVSGKSTNGSACSKGEVISYNWSINNNQKYAFNPTFNYDGGGGSGGGGNDHPSQPNSSREVIKLLKYDDPGAIYRLNSVCEINSDGDAIEQHIEETIAAGARAIAESVNLRIDAVVSLLQGLKDFRQPVCPSEPEYRSYPAVTVRFESIGPSDYSKAPIRKQLTYWDKADKDLCFHANHWDGFTWLTGPVRVKLVKSPIGYGEVWARSEEEGKRVLRHAAAASGVILTPANTTYRIIVTTSGRMGVETTVRTKDFSQNSISVTKRNGAAGRPEYPHRV